MSRLGEGLAWTLNQRFPVLSMHRELQNAKSDVQANQQWAFEEAVRVQQGFEPYWDLRGLHILDIGTGLGGKLPFYVLNAGAATVVGIDLNVQSVHIANNHVMSQDLMREACGIKVMASDAARLPFSDNHFDAIVSINVFEHIERLAEALSECYRVLKPDGMAFLHLPPYYSPWGPHLENWIHFPWPHLFFSEKTLMRVAAREDAQQRLNERFVQASRIDWACHGDRIPDVNRVTLGRFRQMVQDAGFSIVQLRLFPVGYSYLKSESSLKKVFLWLFETMSKIPLLQEVIVTKMVYVLQKST